MMTQNCVGQIHVFKAKRKIALCFATTTTENSGFATTTRAHARDSANKGGIPNATPIHDSRSGTLHPTGGYAQI